MAQFAEITLTSTNLTGVTNFFTVDMKECSSPNFTTIQTGLTYSDFPYLVNLDEEFGVISCYNYKISESVTGLICSGQTFIGSVTPTPSITTTPSVTPSTSTIITGVTVTPTPSITTTPSVTPSTSTIITGVTVTPTPSVTTTPSITPSITPTVTITPTPSSTPPSCTLLTVFTGSTFTGVCSSFDSLSVYTNDGSLINGGLVYTDNCPIQGGTSPLPINIYLSETGSTEVYSTFSAGTVAFVGNCIVPTPSVTPTISLTPSVTPSITPTPSYTGITVEFGTSYESGSTIADYSFTASTAVSQDTTIDFTNVLSKTDNTPVLIVSAVTINSGQTIGSSTVTNTTNYDEIRGYETSFTAVTSTGDLIGKTNNTKSVNFIAKNSPLYQLWIFRACCKDSSPSEIQVQVDGDAVASGGWVDLGFGVYLYDNCYIPYEPGGDGSDGIMYGPDFKGCSYSGCLCPSVTPTPTPTVTPSVSNNVFNNYKLISCCDETTVVFANLQPLTPIQIGDIISYNGECYGVGNIESADNALISVSGTFSSCTACQLVQSCPSVTPTLTPSPTPSVDPCADGLDCIITASEECELDCYTAIAPYVPKRIVNCCDYSESFGVMVPEDLEVGTYLYWNDKCWYLGAETTENETYITSFTEYQTCNECVSCNDIADCDGGWITCEVDPCCETSPDLPQGAITFSGNACVGDGIIIDNICYTIINISNGQAGGALVVDESDIIENVCEFSACTGCTITLQSCTMSNGAGDINYFPNYIRVPQSSITQDVVSGDVCLFVIPIQTGSGSLTNTLYVEQCYTVVDNDESVELVNYQFGGISAEGCDDHNGKCINGYVGVQSCGNGQTVIIGIDSLNDYWSSVTVGDVFTSVPIASNPYSTTGFLNNNASSCYTIVSEGTQITVPQQYPGGGTWTTDEGVEDVVDCNDNNCVRCLSGVTVTNDDSGAQPITINWYDCNNDYNVLTIPYNSTHNFGSECINILSLHQLNYFEITNGIIINYDLNNNCE